MNACCILFVDSQPLRTAPLRAHLHRYQLSLALSCEHPTEPAALSQASDAYQAWIITLENAAELEQWSAINSPPAGVRIALRPPHSKLKKAAIKQAGFATYFDLPASAAEIEQALKTANCPLRPTEPDPYLQSMPTLDDESAKSAAMGDEGLVKELRAMLRDDLRQRIEILARQLSMNDIAEAAETVHRLVGGCAYCGAKAMQALSLEFENTLRQREMDKVDEAYARWLLAGEQLLQELDQL